MKVIEEEKDIEELPPDVMEENLLNEIAMNRNKINELVKIIKKLEDKQCQE